MTPEEIAALDKSGGSGRIVQDVLVPRDVAICSAYEHDCPTSLEVPRLPNTAFGPDRHKYRDLSPNEWKMGLTNEYARAAAWGTAAEYEAAAAVIDAWLNTEDQSWWGPTEQCCGGSHAGLHAQAELQALRAAVRKGDTARVVRLTHQLDRLWSIADKVTTPTGVWACIGERDGGVELSLTALWREVQHLRHMGVLKRAPDQLTGSAYYLPARIAHGMLAAGKLPKPTIDAMPAVRRQLTVYRWQGGHLTVMAAFPHAGLPQQWLACNWAELDADEGAKRVQAGTAMPPSIVGRDAQRFVSSGAGGAA